MLSTRALTCSSTLLKLFQNMKAASSGVLKNVETGCVPPKLFYSRFISSSNTDTKEIERVYYGVLTTQIKAVKIISFTTSIGGLLAQPIILQQIKSTGGSLAVLVGLCSFVGFFTFITPLLLHLVTKKYIIHLDYNSESNKYIATILSFFCREKQIEFSAGDVRVPEIPGMFTTFEVNGQSLFVDPSLFQNPMHYGKIMGYDKPIDFKMSEQSNDKSI